MNTNHTIRVITKDIRGALRNDWKKCPIAKALGRLYPGNEFEVYDEYIRVNGQIVGHSEGTKSYSEAWNMGTVRTATLEMPDGLLNYLRTDTP